MITKKSLAIIMTAVTVGLLSILGLSLVSAQEGPSAIRSFDTASVAPGEQVVVTIEATGYGSLGAVTETLPAGFTYDSSSLVDEGEVTEVDARTVRFTLQGADKTFTYTVTASSTPDSYDFTGTLRDSDRGDTAVVGESSVTVEAAVVGTGASATRSFDMASVASGGEVVVTIEATGYGSLGAVTEMLPAGFTYDSSSLVDEGEVTEVDARTVRFTLQGADKTFTYTVTASSTAGSYEFSGMLRDSDRGDTSVGGESSVTVEAAAAGTGPSATRSFDKASVALDGEVVVTITATGYGSLGAVTETLPEGFIYVSSSLVDEGEVTEVDARTVRFTLQGADKTFTYTVTASSTPDSYDFSGMLRDSDKGDTPVGGDTAVAVTFPVGPASRSFSSSSVAPGRQVVVTITATGYGSLGAVTEMLPAGFTYVSSSLVDEGEVTEVDARTVRFTLQGADKTFTYTVTASRTAGSHDFAGTLRDSDRVDTSVGGSSSVRVRTPSTGTGGGGTGGGGDTGSGGDTGGGTPATTTPVGSPPIIAGGTREEFNVPENMTAVTSLSIVDGRRVTWNISGGFDAAEFTIGAESGELTFRAAPDFENPTDEGANNVYVVEVRATDSDTLSDTLLVLVTVTDVVDESTATPTPEPTATLAPTPTPAPTATPTAAPTAMPEPTATSMPEPTATSMPEPTATSMPEPTATSAPVATATSMPVATATSMPEPTATSMPEPTARPCLRQRPRRCLRQRLWLQRNQEADSRYWWLS